MPLTDRYTQEMNDWTARSYEEYKKEVQRLSSEEITTYRETHPQQHTSNPVADLNLRELEYYLGRCNYVLVECVEELRRDPGGRRNFRFALEDVMWDSKETDWEMADYLSEDGYLDVFIAQAWEIPELTPGQRYLFPVTRYGEEERLELYPHHSWYVTEESTLVSLSDEKQTEEHTGYAVEDFPEMMSRLWKNRVSEPEICQQSRAELTWEQLTHGDMSGEEIEELREQYPVQDRRLELFWSLVDTAKPDNWGANFGTIFEARDAVLTGKIISEIVPATDRETLIDLGEWQGTAWELRQESFSLMREDQYVAYWVFRVEEILWKTDDQDVPVRAGDTIFFTIHQNDIESLTPLLKQDQRYLLGVDLDAGTGAYNTDRSAGFYLTEDDYLFSFVSGENSNRFTGQHISAYKLALQEALEDPEKAGTLFELEWE